MKVNCYYLKDVSNKSAEIYKECNASYLSGTKRRFTFEEKLYFKYTIEVPTFMTTLSKRLVSIRVKQALRPGDVIELLDNKYIVLRIGFAKLNNNEEMDIC